jgi:hypothetical protein
VTTPGSRSGSAAMSLLSFGWHSLARLARGSYPPAVSAIFSLRGAPASSTQRARYGTGPLVEVPRAESPQRTPEQLHASPGIDPYGPVDAAAGWGIFATCSLPATMYKRD